MKQLKTERTQLGQRLRAARVRAGVSREEAAEAAEVQPVAVDGWERGKNMPCPIQLRALIALYGVSSNEILFGENPLAFSPEEATELSRAAKAFSPRLRARLDVLLAVMASPGGTSQVRTG